MALGKQKKKSKQKELKTLRRKLHKAWSEKVRKRDKYLCQWHLYDGKKLKSKNNQAHHISARSISNKYGWYEHSSGLAYNGLTLCGGCHCFRLPADPDNYIKFRDAWLAERNLTYFDLRNMYQGIAKLNRQDFEYLLNKLK